ncbi:hypothetical protein TeGR_g7274, partial [Tetraparma gracilis]
MDPVPAPAASPIDADSSPIETLLDPVPPPLSTFILHLDSNPSTSFEAFCSSALTNLRLDYIREHSLPADARLPPDALQVLLKRGDPSLSLRLRGYRFFIKGMAALLKSRSVAHQASAGEDAHRTVEVEVEITREVAEDEEARVDGDPKL